MKILLIRFSALGDVAMVAPVVKELAQGQPETEFWVLSMPFCEPLFAGIGDNVHFLGRNVRKDYKGIGGLYRLFRELNEMGFDQVCDLHDVLRTKVLRLFFRLHGYKVTKIDKERADRKAITAPEGKKQLRQLTTGFEKYRATIPNPSPIMGKGVDTCQVSDVRSGSKGSCFGIAPFAAHAGKIYPLEKMERVMELLIERRPDSRIVLFGGGGQEREQMLLWKEKFPKHVTTARDVLDGTETALTFNKIDKSGLAGELELMKQLDCMVSMDSANMHLASLVGTRVVSVWGATHPFAGFLGWGQRMEDCVQVDLPCRPCSIYGNKPCHRGDKACMQNISPEMIVDVILK